MKCHLIKDFKNKTFFFFLWIYLHRLIVHHKTRNVRNLSCNLSCTFLNNFIVTLYTEKIICRLTENVNTVALSKYCFVCLRIQPGWHSNSGSTNSVGLGKSMHFIDQYQIMEVFGKPAKIIFLTPFGEVSGAEITHFDTDSVFFPMQFSVHFQKGICVIFMHNVKYSAFIPCNRLPQICNWTAANACVCASIVALDLNVLQQRGDDLQCSAQGTLQNTFGVRSPLLLWPSPLICHAGTQCLYPSLSSPPPHSVITQFSSILPYSPIFYPLAFQATPTVWMR